MLIEDALSWPGSERVSIRLLALPTRDLERGEERVDYVVQPNSDDYYPRVSRASVSVINVLPIR